MTLTKTEKEEEVKVRQDLTSEVKKIIKKFLNIVFIDEKSAIKTDQVQCKIYMKHDRLIRMPT